MAEELVRLTNLNEDMQEQLTEISTMRIQLKVRTTQKPQHRFWRC